MKDNRESNVENVEDMENQKQSQKLPSRPPTPLDAAKYVAARFAEVGRQLRERPELTLFFAAVELKAW